MTRDTTLELMVEGDLFDCVEENKVVGELWVPWGRGYVRLAARYINLYIRIGQNVMHNQGYNL